MAGAHRSRGVGGSSPLASTDMAVAVREPSEGRAQVIAFLLDAYDGVPTKPGKGLPHAQAVADVLRDAGYDLRVLLAGLLHDIVEDTDRSADDVREHFGETVARPATIEFGAVTDTFTVQPGFTVAIVASGGLVVGIAANRVDDYVARKDLRVSAASPPAGLLTKANANAQTRLPYSYRRDWKGRKRRELRC
jgi:HD domain